MKAQTGLMLLFLILTSCNYRLFDIEQFPELKESPFSGALADKPTQATFTSIYQTIIQPRCLSCHKPDSDSKAKALPFLTYDDLFVSNDDGNPLITPGDVENSLFYQVMIKTGKERMPPDKNGLTAIASDRVEMVKRWIQSGAFQK